MSQNSTFEWAVIGAGPAGIATIGQLLEKGILASIGVMFQVIQPLNYLHAI